MSTTSSLFADRILNIAVTGSLVRLQLGTLLPPKAEGEKPQLTSSQTLVMPLDGFLQSFGMLEAVVKKLIADGVLRPKPAAEVASTTEAPPTKQ